MNVSSKLLIMTFFFLIFSRPVSCEQVFNDSTQESSTTVPQQKTSPTQRAKSALGIGIVFSGNHGSYNTKELINDPRYINLVINEKLIDAIYLTTTNGQSYLLVLEIIKNSGTSATVKYEKYPVVEQTSQKGLIVKRLKTHELFYYSGYLLLMKAWKSLSSGEKMTDEYCKSSLLPAVCESNDLFKVTLTKTANSLSDVPVFIAIK